VLDQLHSSGAAVRGVLARVPMERREAIVEKIELNIYGGGPANKGGNAVYFRAAWHFCDLVPTERLARAAAASLVRSTSLVLDSEDKPALLKELADGLATRFVPYGTAGRAALEEVLPSASPETAGVIQAVLAAITVH
jgi:hypothetical protein